MQSFTVYFPRFHFEIQEEFSITFDDAAWLPFTVGVTERGIPHIQSMSICIDHHCVEEQDRWRQKGLKPGLRIIAINNHSLRQEKHGYHLNSEGNRPYQMSDLESLVEKCGGSSHSSVQMTFREDIPPFYDSRPLGLQFSKDDAPADEQKSQSACTGVLKKFFDISPTNIISDEAIGVSSFFDDERHYPNMVRLNTPDGYWRPSEYNEKCRADVWVCFDLGERRNVDQLQLQGSQVF